MPDRGEIDLQRALKNLWIAVCHRGHLAQLASIGHKAVQPPPALGNRPGQTHNGRQVCHIHLYQRGLAAALFYFIIQLFERASRAGGDNQLCPNLGTGEGHRPAKAAAGPGYQNQPACKIVSLCHATPACLVICRKGQSDNRR